MKITSSAHRDAQVLTVEGAVGPAQMTQLRAALQSELVREVGGDVILDVRRVGSFDDEVLMVLTAGRTLGKSRRRRIVVVDDAGGATCRSLRRSGQIFRFPVYPDVDAASAALVVERRALDSINPVVRVQVVDLEGGRQRLR